MEEELWLRTEWSEIVVVDGGELGVGVETQTATATIFRMRHSTNHRVRDKKN